jgi:hypothetical protein
MALVNIAQQHTCVGSSAAAGTVTEAPEVVLPVVAVLSAVVPVTALTREPTVLRELTRLVMFVAELMAPAPVAPNPCRAFAKPLRPASGLALNRAEKSRVSCLPVVLVVPDSGSITLGDEAGVRDAAGGAVVQDDMLHADGVVRMGRSVDSLLWAELDVVLTAMLETVIVVTPEASQGSVSWRPTLVTPAVLILRLGLQGCRTQFQYFNYMHVVLPCYTIPRSTSHICLQELATKT